MDFQSFGTPDEEGVMESLDKYGAKFAVFSSIRDAQSGAREFIANVFSVNRLHKNQVDSILEAAPNLHFEGAGVIDGLVGHPELEHPKPKWGATSCRVRGDRPTDPVLAQRLLEELAALLAKPRG
ncbi:MAG: hypothetical protein WCS85_05220 [Candidatus Peribacteraceae bacterium]|jgi:hypothetical protein